MPFHSETPAGGYKLCNIDRVNKQTVYSRCLITDKETTRSSIDESLSHSICRSRYSNETATDFDIYRGESRR